MINKFLKPARILGFLIVLCLFISSAFCLNIENTAKETESGGIKKENTSKVEIVKTQNGFQLLKNGQPFFIKGAGGSKYLDKLVEAGGNSVRTWASTPETLDQAYSKGISVMLGLRMGKPRSGFSYFNKKAVTEQFERNREIVLKLKDHPAILIWGIGNEVDLAASDKERIQAWKEINKTAEMIKQIDGNHPVITVIAGAESDKLIELQKYCPVLDAVGINTYGKILDLPEEIAREGWDKPYIVTEFGPIGWWETDKRTAWGLPVEDTSTEKAEFYLKAYRHAIEKRPTCLGSYVFLWGNKQEKTHTWFGLFLPDGSPTSTVDAMSLAWTGKWPANRCPIIGPRKIQIDTLDASLRSEKHIYKPKTRLSCTVDANDPEGDPLTIKWELRLDVSNNPSIGGDPEKPTPPINAAVLSADKNQAVIQLPAKKGDYRIFVYVYDDKGHAATANLPIACRK
jgi:hypothetical protein